MPVSPAEPPTLVLASASPRRRELLRLIWPESRTIVRPAAGFVEPPCPGGVSYAEAAAFVRDLAEAKAAAAFTSGGPVLAADTLIVTDGGEPLGKPPEESPAYEAGVRRSLSLLSGREHAAVSGVCVRAGADVRSLSVVTRVWFRDLAADEVERYAATGEPRGKAGAYAIQGLGAAFVESVEGSLSNVVGLPVAETAALLAECGLRP